MKKILLISPLPPPVGGIASWTVNILDYFNNYHNPKYKLEHLNSAIQFRSITSSSKIARIYYGIINFVYFYRKLFSKLLDKPNLCHFTSSGSLGLLKDLIFIVTCNFFNVKTIIHYRFGRIPEISEKNNWEWKILKLVNRLSTFVIVLDYKSVEVIESHKKEVYLVENPISPQLIKYKSQSNVKEENTIVFVGHVTKMKGIFELFQALKQIDKKLDVKIIGPYEDSVRTDLEKIFNLRVKFYGSLSKKEVYQEMINSKILVLPSYTEGFPNVIVEGMALGCAIIATNVGAIKDMIHPDRGILINPKSVNELTEAINSLVNNESKRIEIKHNAEKFAMSNYSIEDIIKKLESIWI
jgi:glycosyltransferase involved in cell wall biosynthesis